MERLDGLLYILQNSGEAQAPAPPSYRFTTAQSPFLYSLHGRGGGGGGGNLPVLVNQNAIPTAVFVFGLEYCDEKGWGNVVN